MNRAQRRRRGERGGVAKRCPDCNGRVMTYDSDVLQRQAHYTAHAGSCPLVDELDQQARDDWRWMVENAAVRRTRPVTVAELTERELTLGISRGSAESVTIEFIRPDMTARIFSDRPDNPMLRVER